MPALIEGDEPHAAQDERPHEDLHDLRVGLDDVAQRRFADREDLTGLPYPYTDKAGKSTQGAHFTCEVAWGHGAEGLLVAVQSHPHALEAPRQHYIQIEVSLPHFHQ